MHQADVPGSSAPGNDPDLILVLLFYIILTNVACYPMTLVLVLLLFYLSLIGGWPNSRKYLPEMVLSI